MKRIATAVIALVVMAGGLGLSQAKAESNAVNRAEFNKAGAKTEFVAGRYHRGGWYRHGYRSHYRWYAPPVYQPCYPPVYGPC